MIEIKILIVILCDYIVIAHFLSRRSYLFCKQNKECRNINCAKAKECKCNSLYSHDND